MVPDRAASSDSLCRIAVSGLLWNTGNAENGSPCRVAAIDLSRVL